MVIVLYDYLKDIRFQKLFFDTVLPAQAAKLHNYAISYSRYGLPYIVEENNTDVQCIIAQVNDSQFTKIKQFYSDLGYISGSITLNNVLCTLFTFDAVLNPTNTCISVTDFQELILSFRHGDVNALRAIANMPLNVISSKAKRAVQRYIKEQEQQRRLIYITIAVAFILSLVSIILFLINTWSQSSDRLADRIIEEATSTRKVYINEGSQTTQGFVTFEPFDITDQLTEPDNPPVYSDTTTETTSGYSFLELDWTALKQKYPNLVGWLYIPGVEINYPVAQGTDNEFYLNHLIDGRAGLSGWLFADYQLQNDTPATNYVIYGHNMADGSMFGHLKHVTWEGWWSNPSNQYIYYATENYTAIYQVFNAMTVKSTQVYYHNVNIDSSTVGSYIREMTQYNQMGDKLTYSMFFDTNSKLITLSTCNDSEGAQKFVLQGVLVAVR